VWSGELTQTTKAGQKIIVACHMQRVDQPDGTQLVLETHHDITARVALEEAMVAAGERERMRLGQDLHDGLCQLLTASRLKIESLAARLAVRAPTEVGAAKTALSLLTQALEEARRLARGLEPVAPVPEGLMVALKTLADSINKLFNVACGCAIPEPVFVFDPKAATELFRITQEATNNAIKHGQASSIRIRLTTENGTLILSVASDGKPFPRRPNSRGTGLKSMQYRARRIPGTLEIGPGAGGGTLVRCVVRLAPAQSPGPEVGVLSPAHQMVLSALRSGRAVGERPNPSKPDNL
jgi:signal transduction histidine kinase